jgi:hypothetical protein
VLRSSRRTAPPAVVVALTAVMLRGRPSGSLSLARMPAGGMTRGVF